MSPNPDPNSTNASSSLKLGNGITARLLSKPPSRYASSASKQRSQSNHTRAPPAFPQAQAQAQPPPPNPVDQNPTPAVQTTNSKSRGVLLCGDVVPIKKRNGATGSATLWVKEKQAGLIWVMEEIMEDVALIHFDDVGCVISSQGSTEPIWGTNHVRNGTDMQKLIPAIPKSPTSHTGTLDLDAIFTTRNYTACTNNDFSIPIAIERESSNTLRVSSFPHIAGIIVLDCQNLNISSCNTVVTSALFGHANPAGLCIDDLIPGFSNLLTFMIEDDHLEPIDGIVIPEHNFRRARSMLARREGKEVAVSTFLRPSGLVARHRDGSEFLVDVQMRVVRSGRSELGEDAIEEKDEALADDDNNSSVMTTQDHELVYALWITYSRQIHTSQPKDAMLEDIPSETASSCSQTSNGPPTPDNPSLADDLASRMIRRVKAISTIPEPGCRTSDLHEIVPFPPPLKQLDGKTAEPKEPKPTQKKAIDDFIILEDMGQGAYGQVKMCRYKQAPNDKVVIKYVTKKRILVDTWTRDRVLGTVPSEIHILNYLRKGYKHKNIVEMKDFFEDNDNYYIEMEPLGTTGMDLFDYIELYDDMRESEARRIFVQVANAVQHLHNVAKVVHRDIKDENVILGGDRNIKLIDFGSAAYVRNGPFSVFVGTVDYAAPEVLDGKAYRGKEQDVWALGILLYTILYKENPFYSIDEIMDHDLRVPYIVSVESIHLIRSMLNRDISDRISVNEVLDHAWCRGLEFLDAPPEGGSHELPSNAASLVES